ncbi:MAG: hypothetical protein C0404_14195 [Verrucomicrobia bacterium]|nr:hypothetical protein [Verrucomicrobiota bacterium]
MTAKETNMQTMQAYDAIAADFDRNRSRTGGLEYVDRFCNLVARGGRVLDIGCGAGIPVTQRLVSRGFAIVGLDFSARMLELARKNVPEAAYELADISTWTPVGRFDGVIAWDSTFHLPPEQHVPVLGKIHGALNLGGLLMMTYGGRKGQVSSTMFGQTFQHFALASEEYSAALQQFGFNVIFTEVDDPSSAGHVILCARKTREK